MIDVGRLGLADRQQDLALITRSVTEGDLDRGFGDVHAALLLDELF